MRIQAPMAWAGRTLGACEVGGDPFWVAFDAAAQADVSPSQATHLQRFAGFPVTVLPDAPAPSEAAPAAPAKARPPRRAAPADPGALPEEAP